MIEVKKNQVHEPLYIWKWKHIDFLFVEEKVWDNIAHSDHLSLSEEQETALRFKYLITHWLKWYLMPQASTTLRSNIKFTQKQETAQKSMEHSVSSKKSLLQPSPIPQVQWLSYGNFLVW